MVARILCLCVRWDMEVPFAREQIITVCACRVDRGLAAVKIDLTTDLLTERVSALFRKGRICASLGMDMTESFAARETALNQVGQGCESFRSFF